MLYGKGSVSLHSEEWIWSYTSSFSKRQGYIPPSFHHHFWRRRRSLHARPQNTCAQHTMHAASLPQRDEYCSNIFSSFSKLRPDSTFLDSGGDFSHVVFSPTPCIKQLLYFTWCNGWPMVLVTRAHRFSKLAFRGGIRIINPPLSNLVICLN